jgi:tRNA isopentenyl-2-thiomethyl-A-37 hydroxylase MiaE
MELQNTKLGLKLPTDPRWVDLAGMDLAEILSDHAYCEQKAATSCISLVQAYPEKEKLVEEVAPIVTEEWGHFRMVLAELKKRGLKLGRQRKDEYVNKLLEFQRKGVSREEALLERLLICALIEARSCERFRLLSLHIADEDLRGWYQIYGGRSRALPPLPRSCRVVFRQRKSPRPLARIPEIRSGHHAATDSARRPYALIPAT